jgi:hypothetical protein
VEDQIIESRRWAGVIWRKIRFYCNGAIVKQLLIPAQLAQLYKLRPAAAKKL